MYSITNYGAMIADRVRVAAYAEALRRVITPDSVVVDLGAGTGIFSLLACRLGARRVYAIEPADAIQVAKETAAANGCGDRIHFLQALSTEVTLPERADVIVSDIGGVVPWFQTHLPSIIDARNRLLAPGGVLIPQQDSSWAAVVQDADLYMRHSAPWTPCDLDFDFEPARQLAVNTFTHSKVTGDQLLTEPQRWGTVDYRHVGDANVRAVLRWTASRAGTAHGIVIGLDRTLGDGIRLCNIPGMALGLRDETIYTTLFFPWSSPVVLGAGDAVEVELRATLIGGEYTWCWNSTVMSAGEPSRTTARFAQSTLLGLPLSPTSLRKSSASYRPALNEQGRMVQLVLQSMSQGLAIEEIAERLSSEFRATGIRDPLSYVAMLARQYG